ncbi:MAG: hypothetical protein JWM82_433 [Myxococcales bacterium]|nr:hypothetical protein [Myxococcales bacterium]
MRGTFVNWGVVATFVVGLTVARGARDAQAKGKKPAAAAPVAPRKDMNACGCYKDGAGACLCSKKGKCDCPGECEPKGCEEKRAKEMEKEIAAETKKAAEADKKQRESGDEDDSPAPAKKKKTDGTGQ